MSIVRLRAYVKRRDTALARGLFNFATAVRDAEVPTVPGVHAALYTAVSLLGTAWSWMTRVFWWTPIFKSRLAAPTARLSLAGGMPQVLGPLAITFGDDCRVSAQSTFTGRWGANGQPRLDVGRNCDIGWMTTIAVGSRVTLGDNFRIAGRAFLAGYPGHPLDPIERAEGKPDHNDQVGDIVLEDDVWLATGVTVSAGVRIGRGTVVAAGSVVTRDLPPMVIAAGVPARPVRRIVDGEAVFLIDRRAA